MDTLLAISTLALAIFTAAMALSTWKLADEAREAAGVQTWIEFQKRFDSNEMIRARKKLAIQLQPSATPLSMGCVSETVMNFFEDLGTIYRLGHINTDLAESSFSWYGCRWYEATTAYINGQRKRNNDDGTIFKDFEDLAKAMRMPNEKIDEQAITKFLEDEAGLTTD